MPKPASYLVSLDIGSTKVCALIAEPDATGRIDIIGKGTAAHKGARKGAIIDVPVTVDAIKRATEEAEIMAGAQIERAVVGVAGPAVKSFNSRQVVAVAAKNREITREDIQRSLDAARSVPIPSEFEILHVLPREFVVDGQDGVADPLGMVGSRLEADVHVVTVAVATTQNLLNCVNRAGVEVIEMVLEPLAASEAVLTPDERELGVVLADIGGGTTEVAVWRHGALAHTSVLPVGGDHFTNDLAVVLKTPVPDAERLKRKYGAAMAALVSDSASLAVPLTGGRRRRAGRPSGGRRAGSRRGRAPGRAARPRRADGRHRLAGMGLCAGSPALRPRHRGRVEEALARRRSGPSREAQRLPQELISRVNRSVISMEGRT